MPIRDRGGTSTFHGEMWKQATRPLFLILFLCMWMTAAVEIGPDQWFPRVMGAMVPQLSPESGSGVLFLVYTAGLMFVLRMWGSGVTHKSPLGTLIGSSMLAGIGSTGWARSRTTSAVVASPQPRICVGKTCLWPRCSGSPQSSFCGACDILSIWVARHALVGLVLTIRAAHGPDWTGRRAAVAAWRDHDRASQGGGVFRCAAVTVRLSISPANGTRAISGASRVDGAFVRAQPAGAAYRHTDPAVSAAAEDSANELNDYGSGNAM